MPKNDTADDNANLLMKEKSVISNKANTIKAITIDDKAVPKNFLQEPS